MHCSICDFFENPDDPKRGWNIVVHDKTSGKPVCKKCISASKSYRVGGTQITKAADIVGMIEELEERIPELFNPTLPVCPGNCRCECTKVCNLLAKAA